MTQIASRRASASETSDHSAEAISNQPLSPSESAVMTFMERFCARELVGTAPPLHTSTTRYLVTGKPRPAFSSLTRENGSCECMKSKVVAPTSEHYHHHLWLILILTDGGQSLLRVLCPRQPASVLLHNLRRANVYDARRIRFIAGHSTADCVLKARSWSMSWMESPGTFRYLYTLHLSMPLAVPSHRTVGQAQAFHRRWYGGIQSIHERSCTISIRKTPLLNWIVSR
jgi:hypothetical protein